MYTLIALVFSQYVTKTLAFDDSKVYAMVLISFCLLNMFVRPTLDLVSLPSKGPVFLIICAFLSAVLVHILAVILPGLDFLPASTPGLIVGGFVIPSAYLTSLWAGVFTGVLMSLVYNFFTWLGSKK